MAQVCRLANEGAGTTYDLLAGVLKIRFNTWRERPTRDGNIISTFELIGVDTDANIIAATAEIDKLIEAGTLANENDRYRESLWFEYNADAETAKRSLVQDIQFLSGPQGLATPLLGKTRAIYKMAITHGIWEDRAMTAAAGLADVNMLGGNITFAAEDGSAPARISFLEFHGKSGGGGPIDRVWAGIRPTRFGVSSMVTLWELENGTNGTDATDAIVAGGSPNDGANNQVTVTFATNTMINRVAMTVDDAIADSNYSHAIGRYMVLLRYSTETGSDEFVVEMRTGYPNNTTFAPHGEHVLSGTTNWRLEPMGEIQIPPWPFRENTGNLNLVCRDFTIQLHAIRTTGNDDLYLDALILIPSEHFISFEGAELEYDGFAAEVNLYITEYGEEVAIFYDVNQRIKTNLVASFNDWRFPIEGGLLVVAGERTASSVLADVITVGVSYYPRHRNHREA